MKFNIIVLGIFILLSVPLAHAHGIVELTDEKTIGEYIVRFDTTPSYPVVYKEVHLEIEILNKTTKEFAEDLNVKLGLRKVFIQEENTRDFTVSFWLEPNYPDVNQKAHLKFEILNFSTTRETEGLDVSVKINNAIIEAEEIGGGLYDAHYIFKAQDTYEIIIIINGQQVNGGNLINPPFIHTVGQKEALEFFDSVDAQEEENKYDAHYTFREGGRFEIKIIAGEEEISEFILDVPDIAPKGIIDMSILGLFLFLLIGFTYATYTKARKKQKTPQEIERSLTKKTLFLSMVVPLIGLLLGGIFLTDQLQLAAVSVFLYGVIVCTSFGILGGWLGAIMEEDAMPCMDMGVLSSTFAFVWAYIGVLVSVMLSGLILLVHWTFPFSIIIFLILTTLLFARSIMKGKLSFFVIKNNLYHKGHVEMKFRVLLLFGIVLAVTTAFIIYGPILAQKGYFSLTRIFAMFYAMMGGLAGSMVGGWIGGALLDKHQGCPPMENQIMIGGMAFMAAMMGAMLAATGGMFATVAPAGTMIVLLGAIVIIISFYSLMVKEKYNLVAVSGKRFQGGERE